MSIMLYRVIPAVHIILPIASSFFISLGKFDNHTTLIGTNGINNQVGIHVLMPGINVCNGGHNRDL